MKVKELVGLARHEHFGLRLEWLALCLREPDTWPQSGALGNRQVDSLRRWLKTAGLVGADGQQTALWRLFEHQGVDSLSAWQLLWVSVCFNFPTARWYVSEFPSGSWRVDELKNALQRYVPRLAARTAYNAILELVGLLERTPVGRELGQGIVTPGRPRRVTRTGYPHPEWAAVSWALERLWEEEGRQALGLEEDLLWPWVIFGCNKQVILQQLLLHPEGPWRLLQRQLVKADQS